MPTKAEKRAIQQLEDLAESLTSSSKHYSDTEVEVINEAYETIQTMRLGKGGYAKWCQEEAEGTQYNPDHAWLKVLQSDLDDVSRGDCQFLAISAPPRHGKTSGVTLRYPAYSFERGLWDKCMVASHTADMATEFSRGTRRIVDERMGLQKEAERFWIAQGGAEYQAISVGKRIAGKGVQLLILDDLIGSRADAESEVKRNRLAEWVESDILRRIDPGAFAVILIMCMTGDTPVLMADGTERHLREIKVGDSVATFDEGKLSAATVLNHASNGHDCIYKLTTSSGRIVHANERHPFLIEEHGELKWVQMKDLHTAGRIVVLKEHGKGKLAQKTVVASQLVAEDFAKATTTRGGGHPAINRRLTTQHLGENVASKIDTESLGESTTRWSRLRMENVPFASSPQAKTSGHIGEEGSVSTIVTKPIQLEASCATTATWQSDTLKLKRPLSPLLNTSNFTTELIVSIEPDGVEEVFDVQIERTENFIANGIVSHNTRWHPDDIWTKIVDERFRVRRFPAICDYDPTDPYELARQLCPMGRKPGEPLCPELWPLVRLLKLRAGMSAYTWLGMYQQRPEFKDGLFFEVDKIHTTWGRIPQGRKVVGRGRFYDYAATDKKESSEACYTATMRIAKLDYGDYVVEHADRIQAGPAERDRWMRRLADKDHQEFPDEGVPQIEEMQPAAAGIDRVLAFVELMSGYHGICQPISGSKAIRADPAAGMVGRKACHFLAIPEGDPDWHKAVLSEMRSYPQTKYKDYVDTFSLGYSWLAKRHGDSTIEALDENSRPLPRGRELFGRRRNRRDDR